MWRVFHVNTKTGERVPFPCEEMSESEAKQRASDCRVGRGRGDWRRSDWTIEAHEDCAIMAEEVGDARSIQQRD